MPRPLAEHQVQQQTKAYGGAQQHRPADVGVVYPAEQGLRRSRRQAHGQKQSRQSAGQQEKQRRQPPGTSFPPPGQAAHGRSRRQTAQGMRQLPAPGQEHRRRICRPQGRAQAQPPPPQGQSRQPGRGQQQKIVHRQVQQHHPVQIHHRHGSASFPPSIIPDPPREIPQKQAALFLPQGQHRRRQQKQAKGTAQQGHVQGRGGPGPGGGCGQRPGDGAPQNGLVQQAVLPGARSGPWRRWAGNTSG